MAQLSDYLKGKQLDDAKELLSYAKQNNFYVSMRDQTKEKVPRVFISVYPEGKPESTYGRHQAASWYFYLQPDADHQDFGSMSEPHVIRGGGKEYKNFKRFLTQIKQTYDRYVKRATLVSEILNQVGFTRQATIKKIASDTVNCAIAEAPPQPTKPQYAGEGAKEEPATDDKPRDGTVSFNCCSKQLNSSICQSVFEAYPIYLRENLTQSEKDSVLDYTEKFSLKMRDEALAVQESCKTRLNQFCSDLLKRFGNLVETKN